MKRSLTFLVCILFSLVLFAQQKAVRDKITLKTGEVYIGKITLNNADVIMVTDVNGRRYQFQQSEVKSVETTTETTNSASETDLQSVTISNGNFGAMVELSAGLSKAKNCFGWSPNTQLSLLFGHRKMLGDKFFLGIGAGYNSNFTSSSTMSFVPVFARIQGTFSKGRTTPYIGMDAGYAVALTDGDKGGALVRVSAGFSRKISYKGVFFAGVYAGVQSFSTTLTEVFESKPHVYFGSTSLTSLGVKVGLQF